MLNLCKIYGIKSITISGSIGAVMGDM